LNNSGKFALACWVAVLALSAPVLAADNGISRVNIPNAPVQIAAAVTVPPGYTTYYLSGTASIADPTAPEGSPKRYGNTEAQTAATLKTLSETLGKLGLTFGDVVAAHCFIAGDPAMGGKMDFAGMNRAWAKAFGTKAQPNKPARAAFQISALAAPGALVEIEFIAAKKAP